MQYAPLFKKNKGKIYLYRNLFLFLQTKYVKHIFETLLTRILMFANN